LIDSAQLLNAQVIHYNLGTDLWFPVAVGVLVAVISVTISEYRQARRNSRLRFRQIEMQVQVIGSLESVVWRMPITNVGSRPALELTTEVSIIEDAGVVRAGIVVAPLNWMHNPAGLFSRSVFRSQVAYLDICQWNKGLTIRPILSNSPVMGIRGSSELRSNSERVRIDFFQHSGQRIEVWVQMELDEIDFQSSSVFIESVTRFRRFLFFQWPTRRGVPSDFLDFSGTW
jgi:hypothetical protein